jgi:DNA-binding GntR family transcriptional regulator
VRVNRRSSVPPYQQVAADLRARIASGELAPGSRLPPYPTLADQYGVGRGTVVRAMEHLRVAGLVETGTGGPGYVRELPVRKIAVLRPGAKLATRMPTPAEQEALSIEPGVPVFVLTEASGAATPYPGDRWEFTSP